MHMHLYCMLTAAEHMQDMSGAQGPAWCHMIRAPDCTMRCTYTAACISGSDH